MNKYEPIYEMCTFRKFRIYCSCVVPIALHIDFMFIPGRLIQAYGSPMLLVSLQYLVKALSRSLAELGVLF